MELQRIPQWYVSRLGKFTGSEFHKLMTSGRAKDQLFGQTALTYIDDKVSEIITNGTCIDFKAFQTRATEWGNTFESEAKEVFNRITGIEIEPTGFLDISERFGCSPDGKTTCIKPVEIKCPYNTSNHVQFLTLKKGQDLKETSKEYYTQIQIEILALKAEFGYFISYDPRCSELMRIKVIKVYRDEEFIKDILYRKNEAVNILNQKIDQLFEMCQQTELIA